MLRAYAIPAAYRPFVLNECDRVARLAAVDSQLRDEKAGPMQRLAFVGDRLPKAEGTMIVIVLEHDGRTILEVCRKCGLDRMRAKYYGATCYPLDGYADDGLHYPPPGEDHEFEVVDVPPFTPLPDEHTEVLPL